MTNIEQFTQQLMLAHDIDYETAQYRALTFYENLAQDMPHVLSDDWISVEDRLPDEYEVIAMWGFNYIEQRQYDHGCFYRNSNGEGIWACGLRTVSHWYLLPNPPKDK